MSLPLMEPWRGVRRDGQGAWHIVDRSRGLRDAYTSLCGRPFAGVGWSALAGEVRHPRCVLCVAEYRRALAGAPR